MRTIVLLLLVPALAAAGRLTVSVESALERGTPGVHSVPGQPRVEQVSAVFILPPGADLGTVRLETSGLQILPVADALPSLNGPIRLLGFPGRSPIREPFDPARPFPGRWAEVASTGMMGDLPVVTIRLYPVQFDHGRARRLKSGRLTLTFGERTARSAVLPPAAGWLTGRAINREQAAAWFAPRSAAPHLEILAPAALMRASAVLPVFHSAMLEAGWQFTATEVESFAGDVLGQARADRMREHMMGSLTAGVSHLLLIGDPSPLTGDLPMKLAHPLPDELTHAVPTDLYYSDLSGNWDKNGDGYFGTYGRDGGPDGVDFLPELIVGRVPIYPGRTDQLDAYLRRLLHYKSVPQDPARAVLMPHSVPFLPNELGEGEPMTDGAELGEELSRYELTPAGIPHVKMYEKAGLSPSPYPCDLPISRENLMGRWKEEGVGAVIWYGHGSPHVVVRTMWMQDDGDRKPEADKGEVEQETFFESGESWNVNPRTPAFAFAVACENGYPEWEDNLGVSLLRTGSLALSAASRWAAVYGGETEFEGHASAPGLGYKFMKNALINGMDAGSALGAARSDPATDFNHAYWWANVYDYNLYGDPTLFYAGGQLAEPHPEPSVYWVRTEPAGVSPCGDAVELTVRGARAGETLTVPGAQALGATAGEVEDQGDGTYTVRLDGARALAGRVAVPVALGEGTGAASLTRLWPVVFDEAGNVEGDPLQTEVVDIVEAGSLLAGGEVVLSLRLAAPLRQPSQFQGENFYAAIWSIDLDGDGWEDQSAHFYQYQADEWALYALDPAYEELKAASFTRAGDWLTIRVPAGLIPSPEGSWTIRWKVSAYIYSSRTGYTYQELGRGGSLCWGGWPALDPAPIFPTGAGGTGVGGINLAGHPVPFAIVNPAAGWGHWQVVDAQHNAFSPVRTSVDALLGVAGIPAGMAAYRQDLAPLSLSPLNGDLWAVGDSLLLPAGGTLLLSGMDGYNARVDAGGAELIVAPGSVVQVPWTAGGVVAVVSGQGVAASLSTGAGLAPLRPAQGGWIRAWFPGAAHIDGYGGTRWRSRLVLWNGTPEPSQARLTFHPGGWQGEPRTVTLSVPGGEGLAEEDILGVRFDAEGFGLLEVESDVPLQGWVVTHLEGEAHRGQLIPPLSNADGFYGGTSFVFPESLAGLNEKLFLSNPGPYWMECRVDGNPVGLGPGRNVWMPAAAGTVVEVVKGILYATLSVRDGEGNPGALHLGLSFRGPGEGPVRSGP